MVPDRGGRILRIEASLSLVRLALLRGMSKVELEVIYRYSGNIDE